MDKYFSKPRFKKIVIRNVELMVDWELAVSGQQPYKIELLK